jgi:maleate isomerase
MSAIRHFGFTSDGGLAARASIGLIVLATDQTIEHEYRLMCGGMPGVAVYHSRIYNDARIAPETLRQMEGGIAEAARLILPGIRLDVVGFGCTSATMVMGEETIGARIREGRPGVATTTPITGAFAAFRALGARRLAVLTPYSDEVNAGIRRYLEGRGVEVVAFGSFNEPDDIKVAAITEAAIADAAADLVPGSGAEALFVSCTSLRVVERITELEARIGVPVTSSNHAMGWHSLRLAGVADARPQFGRLFTRTLPT